MAKSLFWRVKVVRSIATTFLVALAISGASAQSLQFKKITYSCKSAKFEKVVEDLSKATGVYFVYSSNKIATSIPVTLSVNARPLGEVLEMLGKQLSVSFKIQDHHITIRSVDARHVPATSEMTLGVKLQNNKAVEVQTDIISSPPHNSIVSEKIMKATELSSGDGDISKYIVKLQPYFNASLLRRVPVQCVRSTARNMNLDHAWFVAAGPVVNEYSAGIEVQAGLRKAYAVFTPTWLSDSKFHGAFGVGTSVQLSNTFSLRPVYSYASLKRAETINSRSIGMPSVPLYNSTTSIIHHQVKLMLQYAINKNISFRAGPTFNLSNSVIKYQSVETGYSHPTNDPHMFYGQPNGGTHAVYNNQNSKTPPDAASNKFWVGWEASFSYRIKF